MCRSWLWHLTFIKIAFAIWAVLPGHSVLTVKHTNSRPLSLSGQHNKVISGLVITGDTLDCIRLYNCDNVVIKDCRFLSSKKNGITIEACRNIRVVNCWFERVATGVYALNSKAVDVSYNQFKNMQGPFPRGQMVQLDSVTGAGNKINYNRGENFPGASMPEDAINIYKSTGTPASPIEVIGNRIRGGGPSKTGGGIMLGDNGGGYIIAKDNILVNPGQYGIAIAGGTSIRIVQNAIYGRRQPFTNVGIYVWNQHRSTCAMNEVSGNRVNFTNAAGEVNPCWNPGNCGKVAGWDNNVWYAKLSATVLPPHLLDK